MRFHRRLHAMCLYEFGHSALKIQTGHHLIPLLNLPPDGDMARSYLAYCPQFHDLILWPSRSRHSIRHDEISARNRDSITTHRYARVGAYLGRASLPASRCFFTPVRFRMAQQEFRPPTDQPARSGVPMHQQNPWRARCCFLCGLIHRCVTWCYTAAATCLAGGASASVVTVS